MKSDMHPLTILSNRYYQLRLPVVQDENKTEEYKRVVLQGEEPKYPLSFSMSSKDTLSVVQTPAGDAEVLYLSEREDFEHVIRSLAYRCEPREIPASMGASTISGIINWEKINAHMDNVDEFLADKRNYLDTLIVLSDGPYSAVTGDKFGYTAQEWKNKSVQIRKYHELTHFVSGRLFPQNKEALRDEIIADMDGITAAVGYYDTDMAKTFLGIEGETYREGGRLQNYVEPQTIEQSADKARELIKIFEKVAAENKNVDIFGLLSIIESNTIGI